MERFALGGLPIYHAMQTRSVSPENPAGDMATMYRWHIMDPICFEKELRVNVQALGPVGDISDSGIYSKRRDIYSSVAYWYQQH